MPGATLHALHFMQEQPRGLVFFLHGNAGNLQTWTTGIDFYRRVNYDLFILDYRGYGKSTGHIESEQQLLRALARHGSGGETRFRSRCAIADTGLAVCQPRYGRKRAISARPGMAAQISAAHRSGHRQRQDADCPDSRQRGSPDSTRQQSKARSARPLSRRIDRGGGRRTRRHSSIFELPRCACSAVDCNEETPR